MSDDQVIVRVHRWNQAEEGGFTVTIAGLMTPADPCSASFANIRGRRQPSARGALQRLWTAGQGRGASWSGALCVGPRSDDSIQQRPPMSQPPRRPRTLADARTEAEAAFKKITTKQAEPLPQQVAVPGVREQVTLRIDQDVLEYFQQDGPGWQDRINAALRKAAGK